MCCEVATTAPNLLGFNPAPGPSSPPIQYICSFYNIHTHMHTKKYNDICFVLLQFHAKVQGINCIL